MTRIIRVIAHIDFMVDDDDRTNWEKKVLNELIELDDVTTNLDVLEEDVTNEIDPKDIIPRLPPMTVDDRGPIGGEPALEITFHEPIPYFGHDPIDERVNDLLHEHLDPTYGDVELDWRDSMTCWVHLLK
jgi:hypothetical protein